MFNMGFSEMLVLGVIALLVIGPKQLPEVARVIGRTLNEFKRATGDLTSSFYNAKREAESYVNKTTNYMHQQREEFENSLNAEYESPDHEHTSHHELEHEQHEPESSETTSQTDNDESKKESKS